MVYSCDKDKFRIEYLIMIRTQASCFRILIWSYKINVTYNYSNRWSINTPRQISWKMSFVQNSMPRYACLSHWLQSLTSVIDLSHWPESLASFTDLIHWPKHFLEVKRSTFNISGSSTDLTFHQSKQIKSTTRIYVYVGSMHRYCLYKLDQ